jgi:hypothetical protein
MCLDAAARAEFGSLDAFRAYWTDARKRVERWAQNEAKPLIGRRPKGARSKVESLVGVENVRVENADAQGADLRADVKATLWQVVEAKKDIAGNAIMVAIGYGNWILPQEKTLIRGPKRWYLTSGRLDEPRERIVQ